MNNGKFRGNHIINPSTVVDSYCGLNRFHHGGNIDGFSAMVSTVPQKGLGFVVLANKNGTGVPELLIRHATDRILGLDPIERNHPPSPTGTMKLLM